MQKGHACGEEGSLLPSVLGVCLVIMMALPGLLRAKLLLKNVSSMILPCLQRVILALPPGHRAVQRKCLECLSIHPHSFSICKALPLPNSLHECGVEKEEKKYSWLSRRL